MSKHIEIRNVEGMTAAELRREYCLADSVRDFWAVRESWGAVALALACLVTLMVPFAATMSIALGLLLVGTLLSLTVAGLVVTRKAHRQFLPYDQYARQIMDRMVKLGVFRPSKPV